MARQDASWATDATEGWTDRDGRCAILAVIDHATGETLGRHLRPGWTASPPPTCCARRARGALGVEKFIETLKKQVLWIERFDTHGLLSLLTARLRYRIGRA